LIKKIDRFVLLMISSFSAKYIFFLPSVELISTIDNKLSL